MKEDEGWKADKTSTDSWRSWTGALSTWSTSSLLIETSSLWSFYLHLSHWHLWIKFRRASILSVSPSADPFQPLHAIEKLSIQLAISRKSQPMHFWLQNGRSQCQAKLWRMGDSEKDTNVVGCWTDLHHLCPVLFGSKLIILSSANFEGYPLRKEILGGTAISIRKAS